MCSFFEWKACKIRIVIKFSKISTGSKYAVLLNLQALHIAYVYSFPESVSLAPPLLE
jgi:hypothetical protein